MPHDPLNDAGRTPFAGDSADAATGAGGDAAHEQIVPSDRDGSDRSGASASDGRDEGSDREPIREEAVVESEQRVRVRRTPRYGRFMILGGAVFAVAAFIVTYSLPQGAGYDRNTVFGFVLLAAVAVGVGLGALAAIIASAATKHTERTVIADHIDVRQPVADNTVDLPDLGELPSEADDEPIASHTVDGEDASEVAGRDSGEPAQDQGPTSR
ncbi:hypothetical protein HII28_10105 [Planctomonas sp. JC2975]|uniref:hypothetical protein n=1 Tax=Planctomonas sp. JC2975 TaxID=2729626 RepID=UPI001475DC96|nr:hypothetical protein [Planctomonas sp. JC2975]NNC12228.1 hypothetical protein [Planctomonas sp. JC2975]